jgi:hypothetical protein
MAGGMLGLAAAANHEVAEDAEEVEFVIFHAWTALARDRALRCVYEPLPHWQHTPQMLCSASGMMSKVNPSQCSRAPSHHSC